MRDMGKCGICDKYLDDYVIHTEYYSLIEESDKISDLGGFICHKCAIGNAEIEKLYHVSNDCDVINKFNPRIPTNRIDEEDHQTPRICLSSSLEGCFTATDWGGINFSNHFWDCNNTFLFRVYEFNIADLDLERLLPSDYLYAEGLVDDANHTDEYWYLDDIEPSKTYLIEVNNYNEAVCDLISCEDIMDYLRRDKQGEEPTPLEELIQGPYTKIEDLVYEIIPDERRSCLYQLKNKLIACDLDNISDLELEISSIYPSDKTKIEIIQEGNELYVIGQLDTRSKNNHSSFGEVDTKKILRYINNNLSAGNKILEKEMI